MSIEKSCGIIPVQKRDSVWHILLVQHQAGHWAMPKGKKEADETDLQTAERELAEETSLKVRRYLSEALYTEQYSFVRSDERVEKNVVYFLAEVAGEVHIQTEELREASWLTFDEALERVTYPQAKKIITDVKKSLINLSSSV